MRHLVASVRYIPPDSSLPRLAGRVGTDACCQQSCTVSPFSIAVPNSVHTLIELITLRQRSPSLSMQRIINELTQTQILSTARPPHHQRSDSVCWGCDFKAHSDFEKSVLADREANTG